MTITNRENPDNRPKQFINKNFTEFRQELLQYAKNYYSNATTDFSENSLGGMFLDFASIVGDSLVYYTEQQFKELDYETATNRSNILKHLRRANIKSGFAYPSSVKVNFTCEVLCETNNEGKTSAIKEYIPILKKGTTLVANNGVKFVLNEDLDFNYEDSSIISRLDEDENPFMVRLSKKGICSSGNVVVENISFPNEGTDGLYLSVELENASVTSIVSVVDNEFNNYYEVESLSQDTTFVKEKSLLDNNSYIKIKPVPYRYIVERDYFTQKIKMIFGNGSGKTVRNEIFENNADLLLPLKNTDNFGRVDLDPSALLKTNSLGISPRGKSLDVTYIYGGGLSHNVSAGSITSFFNNPSVVFPNSTNSTSNDILNSLINSFTMTNEEQATGGAEALEIEDLKALIPSAINSQNRIITQEDLIARVLTMPNDFGKVEKAVALDNEYSSLTKDLFIICKDNSGFYTSANDALKINLSKYINEFRLIGDNFNILDVPVFNFGISCNIKIPNGESQEDVISNIRSNIADVMQFSNLQIGQPINVNKIYRAIETSTPNTEIIVVSKKENIIVSKTSDDEYYDFFSNTTNSYNDNYFDVITNYIDGYIYPKKGGIFEMKYPDQDIKIIVS